MCDSACRSFRTSDGGTDTAVVLEQPDDSLTVSKTRHSDFVDRLRGVTAQLKLSRNGRRSRRRSYDAVVTAAIAVRALPIRWPCSSPCVTRKD
jgi:hypothetical protein